MPQLVRHGMQEEDKDINGRRGIVYWELELLSTVLRDDWWRGGGFLNKVKEACLSLGLIDFKINSHLKPRIN